MSIKRKIWALPVISILVFGLGIGISSVIATGALGSIDRTARLDYPLLDTAKALNQDIGAVTEGLRDAVSEGEKARLATIAGQAGKVRERLGMLARMEGQRAAGERLRKEFDAYYEPALAVARIMLEMEQGDLTHLPVVDDGRVLGVIGRDRILNVLRQAGLLRVSAQDL